jgi:TolB-like protein
MKHYALIVVCSLLFAGCGYRTPGQSADWVGGDDKVLYVELFANRSKEPYLENFVTDEVTLEFSRSRALTLTESLSSADLLLTGTVTDFETHAVSYDASDRISEYSAQMTITARLVRQANGKVVWQESLSRNEYFSATLDKNLQQDIQTIAAQIVARRLAEDLYARMFADF